MQQCPKCLSPVPGWDSTENPEKGFRTATFRCSCGAVFCVTEPMDVVGFIEGIVFEKERMTR